MRQLILLWSPLIQLVQLIQLAAGSQCFFPHAWHGDYFHLGFGSPLVVANSTISEKGRCVESFGSHYVMEEEDRGEKCWRCMTIFRKHHNVLQYKESYCETYFSTFKSLCDNIAGDSPMYSMFRRGSESVRCPFKGPFTFSSPPQWCPPPSHPEPRSPPPSTPSPSSSSSSSPMSESPPPPSQIFMFAVI